MSYCHIHSITKPRTSAKEVETSAPDEKVEQISEALPKLQGFPQKVIKFYNLTSNIIISNSKMPKGCCIRQQFENKELPDLIPSSCHSYSICSYAQTWRQAARVTKPPPALHPNLIMLDMYGSDPQPKFSNGD